MLHHGSRLGPWVTFSKQLSLTVAKKEKNEATLEREQTNLGVERETTRDGEVFRDIAAQRPFSLLTNTSNSGAGTFCPI